MAVSAINYGGFLSSSQINKRTSFPTASEKEVSDLKRQVYKLKTPRELLDLPYGYTILPSNNSNVKGYSAQDLFTIQYKSATTLSDGSKLIRPVSLALGKVDITPTGDGKYEVSIHPDNGRSIHRIVSEEELLSNKALSRGTIKPSNSEKDTYVMNFVNDEGEEKTFLATQKGCLQLLQENLLYM